MPSIDDLPSMSKSSITDLPSMSSGGAIPSMSIAGASPENSIKESPLSIAEQASLGWHRDPKEQLEAIGPHYEDSALVRDGNQMILKVKDKGQWHDADTHSSWSISIPGAAAGATAGFIGGGPVGALAGGAVGALAPNLVSLNTLKNLPSDSAFFMGRYGLRTAAGAAGAAAAVATLPASAPIALAGAASILGSGAGSALSEGVESYARGQDDASVIKSKMAAGMIYGMAQEVGGKAGNAVLKNAAKSFGNALNLVVQNPEGKLAARKLLGMIPGGESDIVVDARLRNPTRNAAFDQAATQDLMDPQATGKISKIQDMFIGDIESSLQAQRRAQGAEFASLQANPKVVSAKIDASKPHVDAIKDLQEQRYLNEDGTINTKREYGEGDIGALNKIRSIQKSVSNMTYSEARDLSQDLSQVLNKGVNNPSIARAVVQLKTGLHNSIIEGIPQEAATKYAGTMEKYKSAMSILEQMEKSTDTPTKTSTFIKQLTSDNPSANKKFLGDLIDAGVPRDLMDGILQTEGSRKASAIFAKPGWMKALTPNGAKIQAGIVTGATKIKSAFKPGDPMTEASLPYADKAFEVLQKLSPADRARALRNPQAIDAIMQGVQQGVVGEKQTIESLLKQGGVK